jgi:hypothetical protein
VRRTLTVLSVMALMVAMLAVPGFAAANPNASCVGKVQSNQTEPGASGDFHSTLGPVGANGGAAKYFAHLGTPGERATTGALSPVGAFCVDLGRS